jgi:hypothetical protein
MTSGALLALAPEITGPVVRVLAVVGGAVVGAFAVGLLAQLLVRALTAQKLPRWPLLAIRLMGGILAGWLVALLVFGGGGGGLGGPGGGWFGPGAGPGSSTNKGPGAVEKDKSAQEKPESKPAPAGAGSLRVEVLKDTTLEKVTGGTTDRKRCYRAEGKLLTLKELQEFVKQRQRQQPPLSRMVIVLYKHDSPEEHVLLVSSLKAWAEREQKMKVDVSKLDQAAPTD